MTTPNIQLNAKDITMTYQVHNRYHNSNKYLRLLDRLSLIDMASTPRGLLSYARKDGEPKAGQQ